MTSTTGNSLRHRHTPFARGLAFVLAALVAYGATVEIVHKHGGISLAGRNASASFIADSSNTSATPNGASKSGTCLLCQFHQHLFVSLFTALPHISPPPAHLVRPSLAVTSFHTRTDAPSRGRAPPQASLL